MRPLVAEATPAAQARTHGWRDAALVLLVASVLTVAMAWPVIQSPSTRLVGDDTAGLYRDPFVSAAQFASGEMRVLQPATDVPAMLLARPLGGIAAYNWTVLVTFPLAALTAWLLAMVLTGSRLAAAAAAFAFAWSPFHVAHAAYHVHIAQVQWWPLFILAIWRLALRPSVSSVALFGGAAVLLAGASYYWAMAALVIGPAALAAALVVRRLQGAAVPRASWGIALGLAAVSAAVFVFARALVQLLHPAGRSSVAR